MSKIKNIIGDKYNRLTVIKRAENNCKCGNARWVCRCDCGNIVTVIGSNLRSGKIKSCGCYNDEQRKIIHKKYNRYEFIDNICIGYTFDNKIFLIDKNKYDLIKKYCWCFNKNGYLTARDIDKNNKNISLHRLVTNCPPKKCVDHINGKNSRFDNRLSNLRICNPIENARNRSLSNTNTIGVKGVCVTKNSKYTAHIGVNNKSYYLGTYNSIEQASDAYDKAAIKYFGEYANLNNYNKIKKEKENNNNE